MDVKAVTGLACSFVLLAMPTSTLPSDGKGENILLGQHSSDAGLSCREILTSPIDRIAQLSGRLVATRNGHGDVLLALAALDEKTDGRYMADVLFRIRPLGEAIPLMRELLSRLGPRERMVTVTELGSLAVYELIVEFDRGSDDAWVFTLNKSGCELADSHASPEDEAVRIRTSAIGKIKFDKNTPSLRDALYQFEDRPLVVEPDASLEHEGQVPQVLYCMAGGPGAVACSWNPGTIGPVGAGSCSVECLPTYYYACCGPGLGNNCECIAYDGGAGGGFPFPPFPPFPPDPCEFIRQVVTITTHTAPETINAGQLQ